MRFAEGHGHDKNRPAYLSGREEDIMAYLYGDQASEIACRVKRHAGHY